MAPISTPLCKPLTRPATTLGVYHSYMVLCIVSCLLLFVWTRSNILALCSYASLHGLGAYATSKDPYFLGIVGVYLSRCRVLWTGERRDLNLGGHNLAFWQSRSFAP